MLKNESYTGTLVWGTNSRDGEPPVRVNRAFPALVTKRNFRQVAALLHSRSPKIEHPRRSSSPYLLSGLARCGSCRKALTASEAKSGKIHLLRLSLPADARQAHLQHAKTQLPSTSRG